MQQHTNKERLPETPDKLLIAMSEPLTEEQQKYLKENRNEKRNVLAKEMGISGLRLIYQLQKLG